jgi:hypothetical protein
MKRFDVSAALIAFSLIYSGAAQAEESTAEPAEAPPPAPTPAPSRIGGHLGVATPYASFSKNDTNFIGQDQFLKILTPIGLTVHTSDKWALDFEFVVATSVLKNEPTGLIVDPGIIYKGLPVALGMRAAYEVGVAPNVGAIPLVNKGFKVGGVTWFIEAAFPTFLKSDVVTFNAVAHTGVAF